VLPRRFKRRSYLSLLEEVVGDNRRTALDRKLV